jgi:molybdopterin molybdotransferase
MDGMGQGSTSEGWQDVRRSGFARRVALAEARRRLTGLLRPTGTERVALAQASGRVTATAVVAPRHVPAHPVALIDGYALSAAATYGADTYNPLPLAGAVEVVAGMPMPPGTDVVLPYAALMETQGAIEVVEPAAPGQGVAAVGSFWREGGIVLPAGRPLSGLDLACAAAAGVAEVEVVRRPEVRLLVRGDKSGMPVPDFLSELITRDGGATLAAGGDLLSALRGIGADDLVLVVGRTGCGGDDDSAPLLAEAGTVTVHGLTLAPGGSAGCGAVGGVPVVLLPGDPLACLAAYELLAGPALRRLAGLPEALPHPSRERRLAAKIASQVGTMELWLVRDAGDEVVPLAPPERATLAQAAQASGFVLVALESEGHDAGETVLVHLLRPGP